MTSVTTILMFIAIASAAFGSRLWIDGINAFNPNPNKKAAIVCFIITIAAFIANFLL